MKKKFLNAQEYRWLLPSNPLYDVTRDAMFHMLAYAAKEGTVNEAVSLDSIVTGNIIKTQLAEDISENTLAQINEGYLVYTDCLDHLVGMLNEYFPLHHEKAFTVVIMHDNKRVVFQYNWRDADILFYEGSAEMIRIWVGALEKEKQ